MLVRLRKPFRTVTLTKSENLDEKGMEFDLAEGNVIRFDVVSEDEEVDEEDAVVETREGRVDKISLKSFTLTIEGQSQQEIWYYGDPTIKNLVIVK